MRARTTAAPPSAPRPVRRAVRERVQERARGPLPIPRNLRNSTARPTQRGNRHAPLPQARRGAAFLELLTEMLTTESRRRPLTAARQCEGATGDLFFDPESKGIARRHGRSGTPPCLRASVPPW